MKDGGPAFPFVPNQQRELSDGRWDQDYEPGDSGMSLRDYFAAAALTGTLAYPGDQYAGSYHNNSTAEATAKQCYELADAMLKARGA